MALQSRAVSAERGSPCDHFTRTLASCPAAPRCRLGYSGGREPRHCALPQFRAVHLLALPPSFPPLVLQEKERPPPALLPPHSHTFSLTELPCGLKG